MPSALISILLPTYNEKENISDLVLAIDHIVVQPKEIIIIDDNSPDGTSQIVQQLIEQNRIPNLRLITRLYNRGLTNSLRDGIAQAHGEIIVWLDCDFSMPPEVIPHLLEKIQAGYDVVVGSRFVPGGSFKKNISGSEDAWLAVILSRGMNMMIRWLLIPSFRDYTSGFIAIKKTILNKIPLVGDYGEYFIDLMVRVLLLNYKVIEIPYICVPRTKGYSKTGTNLKEYIQRGSKYLWLSCKLCLVKYRYKLFRVL